MNELPDAKQIDLVQPASQLFKLHCMKTKLKNCLTTDLAHDIDASMPTGLSHKDGRLFFIKIVSHTFPDKESHKQIIYEYILKLEIMESNNMARFTREIRSHMGHRTQFVEIPWNGSKIENMGRVFNKTNNSEINIYCSNYGSIYHQLRSIPFHTRFHKSKHRRT
jgi:hypothetical protein